MNKSDLIKRIAQKREKPSPKDVKDVEFAVKMMIGHLSQALANGTRIEIRGFGSFSLRYRGPRVGRNPKTGETVELRGRHIPHFKPGKNLRERVDAVYQQERAAAASAAPEEGSA